MLHGHVFLMLANHLIAPCDIMMSANYFRKQNHHYDSDNDTSAFQIGVRGETLKKEKMEENRLIDARCFIIRKTCPYNIYMCTSLNPTSI